MSQTTAVLVAKIRDQNVMSWTKNLGGASRDTSFSIGAMSQVIFMATQSLVNMATEVNAVKTATGATGETIQAMSLIMEKAGGNAGSFGNILRGVNGFMDRASQGGAAQIAVLDTLGLSYGELSNLSVDETFFQISEAIDGVSNDLEKNTALAAIFGEKYGAEVNAALEMTEGNLQAVSQEFINLGRVLSEDQIEVLNDYSGMLSEVETRYKALAANALVPLMPLLTEMSDDMANMAEDIMPKLIPLIEQAIQIMQDSLPIVIQALGMVADGWEKIGDVINTGMIGGGQAEELMNSLTHAVETGAISASDAVEEWERLTRMQRSFFDNVQSSINPIAGATHAIDDLTASHGILRQQTIEVTGDLETLFHANLMAADSTRQLNEANLQLVADGTGTVLPYLRSQAEAAVGLASTIFGVIQTWNTGAEETETSFGSAISKAVENAKELRVDLKALYEEVMAKEIEQAEFQAQQAQAQRDRLARYNTEKKQHLAQSMAAEEQAIQTIAEQTEKANQAVRDSIVSWGTAFSVAMSKGSEGAKEWGDQMIAQIIRIGAQQAFLFLVQLMIPGGKQASGVAGFFKGVFGFSGGGTVGGPLKTAAGGLVPGGRLGDRTIVAATPGERILSRQENSDYEKGNNGGGDLSVMVEIKPMVSTASPSEAAQFAAMIDTAIRNNSQIVERYIS